MQCQRRTDTTFACPVVGRRELEKVHRAHRDRIANIKSAIDTKPPAPQPHLTLYGRDYVAKKKATTEAAFRDLKMIQSIARTMTRPMDIPERKGPASLNADARKQEIFRVMSENHKLLDRIENLKPSNKTSDLVREHREKLRYTINASHSKRLAGEYDDDIRKIQGADKMRWEAMARSTQLRMSQLGGSPKQSLSASMPALPTASSSTGNMSTKKASPTRQEGIGGAPEGEANSREFDPTEAQASDGAAVQDTSGS
eukprot:gnl/TRDRNA2_/TRDRNA2_178885_c0_seq1.p1 gnl/TRDRNA2_/TRDRNA2_178885_c0~~gnl/TRDRNA2_/TRDRNA2_178885_c0_seq1.p1  ORF type:complete len:256 (-),score=43.55 gnl/TRDRNA2_/TRDRNA2_178885_c0_seq1:137-904(-)